MQDRRNQGVEGGDTLKFIFSEKATKFCEISTVDLSYVVPVKSTVEISQNFVAFSEYINFNAILIRGQIMPTKLIRAPPPIDFKTFLRFCYVLLNPYMSHFICFRVRNIDILVWYLWCCTLIFTDTVSQSDFQTLGTGWKKCVLHIYDVVKWYLL